MSAERPTLSVTSVQFFERPVRLRMPFRFGVVTLTEAPQVFVQATIRLADGREGSGWTAELLVPKWFDKSPELSNEDNFDQLRTSLAIAARAYGEAGGPHTAFGLHKACAEAIWREGEAQGLPALVIAFGQAEVDRAVLDALLRLIGVSVFAAARQNLFGLDTELTPDLSGFDLDAFLAGLSPSPSIAARHTVGMVDPLTEDDLRPGERIEDGLPQTLGEVVSAYGVDHFKLKVGGDLAADIDRLQRIAAVIDALPNYRTTLDGNEQFADADGAAALWSAIEAEPRLQRLKDSILFIEQPIARTKAESEDVASLARAIPLLVDESDGTIDAFLRAKALGYTGISSKSCKGFYKALLNRARCAAWNDQGEARYFMSAEDLTTQAGLAVQQDLALASLIGCTHVERNGHHYVDGMAGAPADERSAFLSAHPELYREAEGTVRLRIDNGRLSLGSLDGAGLASAVVPDQATLARKDYG